SGRPGGWRKPRLGPVVEPRRGTLRRPDARLAAGRRPRRGPTARRREGRERECRNSPAEDGRAAGFRAPPGDRRTAIASPRLLDVRYGPPADLKRCGLVKAFAPTRHGHDHSYSRSEPDMSRNKTYLSKLAGEIRRFACLNK